MIGQMFVFTHLDRGHHNDGSVASWENVLRIMELTGFGSKDKERAGLCFLAVDLSRAPNVLNGMRPI